MDSLKDIRKSQDMLCDAIIRPPRAEYDISNMGAPKFRLGNKRFERNDFVLTNKRGLQLQCSWYQPTKESRPRKDLPCLVYLHGNAGCRLDAQRLLRLILPYDITLFTFDFSGCGLSEGEFISLGLYEKDDVETVIEYLRHSDSVSRIALWGRSMGAATAIMFGSSDPSIAGMVLDSPFSNLNKVATELVEVNQIKLPKIVISGALKLIKKRIQERAGFDIEKLNPIDSADSCFIPALFVHGKDDNFILPHHSNDIQKKYGGESNLIQVEGDHNSERPSFCIDSITIFLHNTLLVGEDKFDAESYSEPSFGILPDVDLPEAPIAPQISRGAQPDLSYDLSEDALIEQAIALSLADQEGGGSGGSGGK
eukprot:CAMPEP_0201475458 /NCGR_PEP_ID=MMETSP0151_2-20130828/886_1 /ASSEMBLY_ACC=CAM_ASM_000257 /TAXON_ID=200890 /ORGANISM="Paramoeba atlantica, Strain 621/1 / CCAP 1560/9" /LENGTH=366 /DNA_ID=CAMNT_0047855559 /DNA_START=192 /DNA_END=1292 /DNA_ORIENTATION=-